jgi:hypothetical protein
MTLESTYWYVLYLYVILKLHYRLWPCELNQGKSAGRRLSQPLEAEGSPSEAQECSRAGFKLVLSPIAVREHRVCSILYLYCAAGRPTADFR